MSPLISRETVTSSVCCLYPNHSQRLRLFLYMPCVCIVCIFLWKSTSLRFANACVCVNPSISRQLVCTGCGSRLQLWLMKLCTHWISELSARMDRPATPCYFLPICFILFLLFFFFHHTPCSAHSPRRGMANTLMLPSNGYWELVNTTWEAVCTKFVMFKVMV